MHLTSRRGWTQAINRDNIHWRDTMSISVAAVTSLFAMANACVTCPRENPIDIRSSICSATCGPTALDRLQTERSRTQSRTQTHTSDENTITTLTMVAAGGGPVPETEYSENVLAHANKKTHIAVAQDGGRGRGRGCNGRKVPAEYANER